MGFRFPVCTKWDYVIDHYCNGEHERESVRAEDTHHAQCNYMRDHESVKY